MARCEETTARSHQQLRCTRAQQARSVTAIKSWVELQRICAKIAHFRAPDAGGRDHLEQTINRGDDRLRRF